MASEGDVSKEAYDTEDSEYENADEGVPDGSESDASTASSSLVPEIVRAKVTELIQADPCEHAALIKMVLTV
jgi:hypothetical protein